MNPKKNTTVIRGYTLLSMALFIGLWKAGALAVGKEIILPAPERVFLVFISLFGKARFLEALLSTALRGLAAFALSMLLGSILGFASGTSRRLDALLSPILVVVKATPVLAIILLALIWFPSGVVPVFSALIMSFPVVMADISEGIKNTDSRLLDMAMLFGLGPARTALQIRLPSALPHFVSAARASLGLSWKVVVAGEVLSQPRNALGTGMQAARVLLETGEVFAWALAAILLCASGDFIFAILSRRLAWSTR